MNVWEAQGRLFIVLGCHWLFLVTFLGGKGCQKNSLIPWWSMGKRCHCCGTKRCRNSVSVSFLRKRALVVSVGRVNTVKCPVRQKRDSSLRWTYQAVFEINAVLSTWTGTSKSSLGLWAKISHSACYLRPVPWTHRALNWDCNTDGVDDLSS